MAVPCASTSPTVSGATPADFVGALQSELFAFEPRRQQPERLAVAGHAHALDERVNVVAVAFGVFAALERDHADTFAEQRAIRAADRTAGSLRDLEMAFSWQKIITMGGGVEAWTPPTSARSHRPDSRSRMPWSSATSDEAQAASTR